MKIKKYLEAAALSLAGVCTFSRICKGDALDFTNSLGSVLLFILLFVILLRMPFVTEEDKQKREKCAVSILPLIFGFFFSFCMITGKALDTKGSIPLSEAGYWAALLVWTALTAKIVNGVWRWLKKEKLAGRTVREKKYVPSVKSGLATMSILVLCYLPVFLAVYPGFFVYDAQSELMEVITRQFTTHHPLVHVLFMGGIVQAGYKLFGTYNAGIACYTLVQMLIMAGIFSWCIEKLKARGMGKYGQILSTAFFGLCPVLVMYSLCSAKDGLFTGLVLLTVLYLADLCDSPKDFLTQKRNLFFLGIPALGMMLLRHNGFYAFAVFCFCLILYWRRYWKRLLILFTGIIIVYAGGSLLLTKALHADASENQEMLTVPIMQLTRTWLYTPDSFTQEEREQLYRYLSEDALRQYNPKLSDAVKISFANEVYAQNKGDFWKLWAKQGLKNPATYINAWLMTSYGFWYPDTVIDVYRGNTVFTFTYRDSSYFGYEVEAPGKRVSWLPWLNEVYRRLSLEIYQQQVPVLSMLFSPGFLCWLWMFLLGFLLYCGEIKKAFPFLLPVFCFLTVLLGPTYLVRYVVYLWACLPLLLVQTIRD